MIIRTVTYTAFVLAFTMMPGVAVAIDALAECDEPVKFDGRHYEVVKDNGISWQNAAEQIIDQDKRVDEVLGHLATITSEAEDIFVESLRKCAVEKGILSRQAVWVGGFQAACDDQPGCGWQWVKDEGAISTPHYPLDSYSNWLTNPNGTPKEPNNTGEIEQHLTVGHTGKFGWNDEGNLNNIGGYIIEYDTASNISTIDCIASVGGCQTTAGQTLVLPPGVDPDGSIGVRTFEFTDPRVASGKCGEDPLTLFDGANDPRPELRIPPYLCGSPKFLVVEIDKSGFEILQDTVYVENEPIVALPGNWYDCDGPVGVGAPLGAGDPQARDVVAWQATNHATMLESSSLADSIDSAFVGSTGEFTFECGSSRGLIKTMSYLIIGLHMNFGPGFEGAELSHMKFVALTRYKLLLLQEAVQKSRTALASNGEWTSMRVHVRNALAAHDQGDYENALARINVFLAHVANSTYDDGLENYHGEHTARGMNIKFMYEEKVIPFAP